MPALVMNCLAPSITQPSSSSLARVRTLPASEPASGSVRPKAPSFLPAQRSGMQALLLLLAAEQVDRLRAQRRVRAHRDRHRRVDARELLDRERVGERVAARRRRTPPGTGCPSARARRAWPRSRTGSASRGRAPPRRADLALGEIADGAADQLVVVGEIEVHAGNVSNDHSKFERSFGTLRRVPTRPTRPALRERYDRRRAEVVEGAARVFAERGYDQTSVPELAEAPRPRRRQPLPLLRRQGAAAAARSATS